MGIDFNKWLSAMVIAVLMSLSGCASKSSETLPVIDSEPVRAATVDSTGVPECDEYISKMTACFYNKMPAERHDVLFNALNQIKTAWTDVDDKAGLAEVCKQAIESSKEAYRAIGCNF